MTQEGARAVILAVDDDPDLLALIGKVLATEYEVKDRKSVV